MAQKEEIINKAKSLGIIDGYVNNSEFETLQFIAKKVGMPSYDDRYDSEDIALKEKLDNYATVTNQNDINYKVDSYLPEKIKTNYNQNKISEADKRENYYHNPVEALRRRQEAARAERSRNYKMTDSDYSIKEDGSNAESKNSLDKVKDTVEETKAQKAVIQNKIDSAKSKAYQVSHPIEAAKSEAKAKVKKKAKTLLLKYWWIVAIAALLFLLFIIIMLIIIGSAGGEDSQTSQTSYTDSQYDFTETRVTLTNSYQNESEKIDLSTLSLEDLAQGFVYYEFRNSLNGKSDAEKLEIYKTALIVSKSLALSIGNYDSTTKEITIQSGANGLPYCDISNGCKIIEYNSQRTYVSSAYNGEIPGTVISTIGAMDENDQRLLSQAYSETKNLLLVPNSVNSAIDKFTYGNAPYTQTIKQNWINYASGGSDYKDIVSKTAEYANYKIYDITQYATQYTYAEGNSYWWPIGSLEVDTSGLYSGSPSTTNVSSKYGMRTLGGKTKMHGGIDISGSCSKNVIIAAKSGIVTSVHDGCPTKGSYCDSCGSGSGNNVKIDHGDGTSTVYAHMAQGSIVVKKGQQVKQGEKLGLMGSSGCSTGCHLHFEIHVNGSKVDPLNYVDVSNPRPRSVANVQSGYESGNSNMQTVCLSLKQSGYSNNAVTAIMTNINSESGFKTDASGDSGTSYGLCQWHNGRWTKLKSYCGGEYNTVKCQLAYLIYELKSSKIQVNNYLGTNNSAWEMTRYYCYYFEIPANRDSSCKNRANNSTRFASYVNNNCS